ncbi:hypothetical protein [Companilactobacillus sp. HBUAS59699]|uniref:hypothetical protein n=1 Tax=Companilactobacillus sp. HBUAS59699 TaxID=3109358 RepID=UPI002FEF0400
MTYTNPFTSLLLWASESTANWNQLVGGSFVALIIGLIIFSRGYYLFNGWHFFNYGDERTSKILASTAAFILATTIICDMIFPHAYIWRIFNVAIS